MSLLPDLGDYLTTGSIGLTTGTNLFLGRMPAVPATATAIYETGGVAPVHTFGSSAGAAVMERPRVQIVTRSTGGYDTARTTMAAVFGRLDGARSLTINSRRYDWIAAVHSPFLLRVDENDRALIACNFDVQKVMG